MKTSFLTGFLFLGVAMRCVCYGWGKVIHGNKISNAPCPQDQNQFWELVKHGSEIRQIHLLASPVVEDFITSYPKDGDNIITRKLAKTSLGYEATSSTHGKVWINDEQYFDNVPLIAWEFYIGGYQPAQKWLKDRRGRLLSFEDILHYQKIIKALSETDRIMKLIDEVITF